MLPRPETIAQILEAGVMIDFSEGTSPSHPNYPWAWLSIPGPCQCGDLECAERFIDIVPCWDTEAHILGDKLGECPCGPEVRGMIITHQAHDERQLYERGERKVS